jgi:zinc/manganese transport system permease protein
VTGADLSLLIPPLLAGIVVLATHVPLGRQVLARGIIFIDLTLAQLAGLGVILVHTLMDEPGQAHVQLVAFLAALTGAISLNWAEQRWPDILEGIIGAGFVLAATAAILLLANDPHGGEQLKELLAGQLLWVTYDDLWIPAISSVPILFLWFYAHGDARSNLFYVLFALSVTLSVQLVGVYLVFASLILPALATHRRGHLVAAYLIGLGGYGGGLTLSLVTDLPTSPLIVWMIALIALLFVVSANTLTKN